MRASQWLSAFSNERLFKLVMWQLTQNTLFYGADEVAAGYCNLRRIPDVLRGFWQHGWIPHYWQHDPELVTLVNAPHSKDDYYWVARRDEVVYLKSEGYRNARAIGLPIVYVHPQEIQRQSGSLLVMPPHSTNYTAHAWPFEEYAEAIARIMDKFTKITVCVHPTCWKRGYWKNAFEKRGIEVIQGLMAGSGNHLQRLCRLFTTYDYMTTNGYGSHIAYAAFLGAKVSIFGPYAGNMPEDHKDEPFYIQHPHLIQMSCRASSETALRQQYPELFSHPLDAKKRVDWGRHELGYDNKVTPDEMQVLFRWRTYDSVVPNLLTMKIRAAKIRASIPSPIKRRVKRVPRKDQ